MTLDWKHIRILLLDSDDQFRFWARGLFKQQRVADVFSLSTAEGAPEMTRRGADVVLLEMAAGDLSCLTYLQWLRNPKTSPAPGLPVVVLVKSLDIILLRRLCQLGIQIALNKPVSGEILLKATLAALRNPSRLVPVPDAPALSPAASPPPPAEKKPLAPPRPRTVASPGVAARPMGHDGGLVDYARLPHGHAIAGQAHRSVGGTAQRLPDLDEVPAPKPVQRIDMDDAPSLAAPEKPGWGDALDAAPPSRPSQKLDIAAPVKATPKERETLEVREVSPPALDAEPPGPDLEKIIEDHAIWVRSGGGDGQRALLEKQDLSGRDLRDCLLNNANLRHCDLSTCDLSQAQLHGADLRYAELTGSVLSGSNMAVARLRHAKLRGCRMDGVNLKGADLAGADLSGVVLGDAELAGVNLLGADLSEADLSAARGLSQTMLDGVLGNTKTRLPPGLFLPARD